MINFASETKKKLDFDNDDDEIDKHDLIWVVSIYLEAFGLFEAGGLQSLQIKSSSSET